MTPDTATLSEKNTIRLLPDSVANQIAAGEVIQRPASVVKELVENSIDAGATSVEVIVKDAGRTLIQVVDNGKGMSPTDARMAFERHATSKISKAEDLFALHTMGFRGEALPSIAAVGVIDMRTMRHGDAVGTRLSITNSQVESQNPEACVPGTNIMVKNIFCSQPARRKFLKKDNVELSHIVAEFNRLALVNPGVDFKFINNGLPVNHLPATNLKGRISDLFGASIGRELIAIDVQTPELTISGFIAPPSAAKKRGNHQYFFVNGRNMKHPVFHRTVVNAYDKLISHDCQPSYFINFNIDPSKIDVNVHPQKHEIKFEDESAVVSILASAIKAGLGRHNTIIFDVEDAPEIPVFSPDTAIKMPSAHSNPSYNPFQTSYNFPKESDISGWQALYRQNTQEKEQSSCSSYLQAQSRLNEMQSQGLPQPPVDPAVLKEALPEIDTTPEDSRFHAGAILLHNKYIVTPSSSGLLIIDRYRAHVRILYNRIVSQTDTEGNLPVQSLIFPEIINLTVSQHLILESLQKDLQKAGFDIGCIGATNWAINGVPQLKFNFSPKDMLLGILDDNESTPSSPQDDILQRLALSIARNAAIKAGVKSTPPEIDRLLSDLFSTGEFNVTPDGLPVFKIIASDEIASLFK